MFYIFKKNLYKNIKEPTIKGLRNTKDETEKNFLEKVAINSQGNLEDESGSCGVMVLIKNKKCIIANVGFLVVFSIERKE